MASQMRDHGGGLAAAAARWGGAPDDWLDLSTGINPLPYPVPPPETAVWGRLPDQDRLKALEAAAGATYGAAGETVAAAGAQALIQCLPRLAAPGACVIVSPTYNEHAAAFGAAGWTVREQPQPAPADALVIVNPNNPDGRLWQRERLLSLADQCGLLIVDESFMDATPSCSLAGTAHPRIIILRSLGKFYGLAGARVGFALCAAPIAARLRALIGPWPVSGPGIEAGIAALSDRSWAMRTGERLRRDAERLDTLLSAAGLGITGGTTLFRLARGEAGAVHERLARAHILTRVFPYREDWIRFGLPGTAADWARLERAL